MESKEQPAGSRQSPRQGEEPGEALPEPPRSDAERARLLEELREINERLLLASLHEHELAEAARRQAIQWNAVLNSLTEGVVVADAAGNVVLANPVARRMLELPLRGRLTRARHWARLDFRALDGTHLRVEDQPLSRALRGERFEDVEVILGCRDGSTRRLAFNGSSVRGARGAVGLAVLTFRDVTELRKLEQTKEEYVSLISHDLRTPLTAILGRAQLLAHGLPRADLAAVARDARAILASARRMEMMIEDLVETTRLEAGSAALHRVPVDPRALIRDAIEALPTAGDQQRIQVEAPADLPVVRADRERIIRVVANLLSNALKFSPPESPVEVRVSTRDREVVIAVTDHGIGIPPQAIPHLFEKYFQTEAGKKRGGLGLGLYLSRLIVSAHGGRIWVRSEVGVGSTFSFSLPMG
jgi:NtrC-family two-component system sensor histidine kinase KinB